MIIITLGETLKTHRKQNNYSQEKIAELVGISRQAETKWELNQSAPSTDYLVKLANIYNISMDELIISSMEPQQPNQKQRKIITMKNVAIVWGIILIISIITCIFTNNTSGLGSPLLNMINLMLFIAYTVVGIYIVYLIIKALRKYLNLQ